MSEKFPVDGGREEEIKFNETLDPDTMVQKIKRIQRMMEETNFTAIKIPIHSEELIKGEPGEQELSFSSRDVTGDYQGLMTLESSEVEINSSSIINDSTLNDPVSSLEGNDLYQGEVYDELRKELNEFLNTLQNADGDLKERILEQLGLSEINFQSTEDDDSIDITEKTKPEIRYVDLGELLVVFEQLSIDSEEQAEIDTIAEQLDPNNPDDPNNITIKEQNPETPRQN